MIWSRSCKASCCDYMGSQTIRPGRQTWWISWSQLGSPGVTPTTSWSKVVSTRWPLHQIVRGWSCWGKWQEPGCTMRGKKRVLVFSRYGIWNAIAWHGFHWLADLLFFVIKSWIFAYLCLDGNTNLHGSTNSLVS